jgi:hypothetical protein
MRAFLFGFVALAAIGCVNDDRVFTQGRLQDLCNESIPICGRTAACALDDQEFIRGRFPGGQRLVVQTEFPEQRLNARFLLDELNFPGTEISVQAFSTNCEDFDRTIHKDRDLFQLAGDDRIIDFNLALPGRGDHLVEVFSDMDAAFTMTVEIED